MPTYLRFGDDHSVAVTEDYEEVRRRIEASQASPVPIFEVTRIDGARLLVNANELWTVSEGKRKEKG